MGFPNRNPTLTIETFEGFYNITLFLELTAEVTMGAHENIL